MTNDAILNTCITRTKRAVILTSLVNEPLMAFFALFGFILYKEFNATEWQIAVFLMLKPVLGVFSLYWSSLAHFSKKKIIPNIVWGGLLSKLPFFLLPFVYNAWQAIFLSAWFWFFYRGTQPAWIELLKRNLPKDEQSKIYTKGNMLSYSISVVLAFAVGPLMDINPNAWKMLFPAAGLLGLVGILYQATLPLLSEGEDSDYDQAKQAEISKLKGFITKPWEHVSCLLKRRKDFAFFQWGFFFGGGSIMLMKPAEMALVKLLPISYTHITVAIWTCKGLGFVFASPFWSQHFRAKNIYFLSGMTLIFTALCYILFLFTQGPFSSMGQVTFFFLAYFVYGVWQAGSHLIWPLSGITFAGQESSSIYNTVNVLSVGIRGLIMPGLGSLLIGVVSLSAVFSIGITLCLLGAYLFFNPQNSLNSCKTLSSKS
jgi:MFS family permease